MLTRVRRLTTPLAVTLLAGATALGTVAVASSAAADQGGVPAIPLNTEQETTGSNTGASGFFSYTIEGDELCYTLTVRDLSVPATAAHIHVGPRHVAGPVVIPLTVESGTSFVVSDCVTSAPATLAALQANPRNYYVNVHTPTFPGGEVRGQLK
jgi:CHRD domain